jgi:enamine deaminase RidA (YjgF/YER057c/UK114 family)
VAVPAAAYVPFVRTGNLVFISGHIAKQGRQALGRPARPDMGTDRRQGRRARDRDRPAGHAAGRGGRPERGERIVKVMSLVNSAPPSPNSTW